MKKINLKKLLLSTILLVSTVNPVFFMVSCSAATISQINTSIKIKTNNKFLGNDFSFIPGPQPTFKKNDKNLDTKNDELFFDYWANIIAPSYALASSAISLDSSRPNSHYLSVNAFNSDNREPSFNYAISNSWVSGSDIYVGDEYRFKLMPFEMNLNINGDIPPRVDKDTELDKIALKTNVTMKNLSINFSYFNISDGTKFDNDTAIKQLKIFFPQINFKSDYMVNLDLSSMTTYEIVNLDEDETPVVPQPGEKFNPAKMKVKVSNSYYISNTPGNENNKIDISKDLSLFKDWLLNPEKIDSKYHNLITNISSTTALI
ncbi:MAG: hypothetical protein ACRCUM_03390 [Mycoplasmoidaceae bacterium]